MGVGRWALGVEEASGENSAGQDSDAPSAIDSRWPNAQRPTPNAASAASPLIVLVHGGPTSQAEAGFNPRVAFWVDRGWAVLLVNYRGSTGYGRAYAQALREQWGPPRRQRHRLRRARDGGPRLGGRPPHGGDGRQRGGYTVLLCLARHADVFAAGVDLFGVADLFKLAEKPTASRLATSTRSSVPCPQPTPATSSAPR